MKLKPEQTRRIVFHEITKNAILKAIENPREIDINLVNAQQARRILDRIVGFELSPVLWKKVKPALSAGRVQSVAVRLIVEREREIQAFKSEASYRVIAIFLVPDTDGKLTEMKAELAHRLKTKEEAKAFLESCKDAIFTIEDITKRPIKKSPAAPFNLDSATGSGPQIGVYSGTNHDVGTKIIRSRINHLYAYRFGQLVGICN